MWQKSKKILSLILILLIIYSLLKSISIILFLFILTNLKIFFIKNSIIDLINLVKDLSNILNDIPKKNQIFFQDSATSVMEGIIDLHNDICVFLIFILCFVFYIFIIIIYQFESFNLLTNNLKLSKKLINLNKNLKKFNFFKFSNSFFFIFNKYKPISHNLNLEIVWTLIPTFILFFIAFPSFILLYSLDEVVNPYFSLKILGNQWYWSYEYTDTFIFLENFNKFFFNNDLKSNNLNINFDSYMLKVPVLDNYLFRNWTKQKWVLFLDNITDRVYFTERDLIDMFKLADEYLKTADLTLEERNEFIENFCNGDKHSVVRHDSFDAYDYFSNIGCTASMAAHYAVNHKLTELGIVDTSDPTKLYTNDRSKGYENKMKLHKETYELFKKHCDEIIGPFLNGTYDYDADTPFNRKNKEWILNVKIECMKSKVTKRIHSDWDLSDNNVSHPYAIRKVSGLESFLEEIVWENYYKKKVLGRRISRWKNNFIDEFGTNGYKNNLKFNFLKNHTEDDKSIPNWSFLLWDDFSYLGEVLGIGNEIKMKHNSRIGLSMFFLESIYNDYKNHFKYLDYFNKNIMGFYYNDKIVEKYKELSFSLKFFFNILKLRWVDYNNHILRKDYSWFEKTTHPLDRKFDNIDYYYKFWYNNIDYLGKLLPNDRSIYEKLEKSLRKIDFLKENETLPEHLKKQMVWENLNVFKQSLYNRNKEKIFFKTMLDFLNFYGKATRQTLAKADYLAFTRDKIFDLRDLKKNYQNSRIGDSNTFYEALEIEGLKLLYEFETELKQLKNFYFSDFSNELKNIKTDEFKLNVYNFIDFISNVKTFDHIYKPQYLKYKQFDFELVKKLFDKYYDSSYICKSTMDVLKENKINYFNFKKNPKLLMKHDYLNDNIWYKKIDKAFFPLNIPGHQHCFDPFQLFLYDYLTKDGNIKLKYPNHFEKTKSLSLENYYSLMKNYFKNKNYTYFSEKDISPNAFIFSQISKKNPFVMKEWFNVQFLNLIMESGIFKQINYNNKDIILNFNKLDRWRFVEWFKGFYLDLKYGYLNRNNLYDNVVKKKEKLFHKTYDPIFKYLNNELNGFKQNKINTQLIAFRLLDVDNKIYLPLNTHIRLTITSKDVLHSWTIPSLGVKLDACPGRLNQTSIYLLRSSIMYGQCSELCGVNHGFMPIVLYSGYFNDIQNILYIEFLNKYFNLFKFKIFN